VKQSAAIFLSGFMVLLSSACATGDDDGGGGGGGQSDASGFADAPRASDARPDASTSTLADGPGFMLGDGGGFGFGDAGFDFGDGGFGTCTSNAECTAVDDCCFLIDTSLGFCVTGTETGGTCIPAF
jgi:hypothetical protein